MGRKSVLSDREWSEIGRRLANGESQSKLAKEFGVARSTIVGRYPISDRVQEIKNLGSTLASTELAIERLPENDRVSVRTLADQLKGIQNHYAKAAEAQAEAGAIISAKMLGQAKALPDSPEPEDLKPIMAGAETVKSLLTPATNLISTRTKEIATKDEDDKGSISLQILPVKPNA